MFCIILLSIQEKEKDSNNQIEDHFKNKTKK